MADRPIQVEQLGHKWKALTDEYFYDTYAAFQEEPALTRVLLDEEQVFSDGPLGQALKSCNISPTEGEALIRTFRLMKLQRDGRYDYSVRYFEQEPRFQAARRSPAYAWCTLLYSWTLWDLNMAKPLM